MDNTSGRAVENRIHKHKAKLKVATIVVVIFALTTLVLSAWVFSRSNVINIDSKRYQAVFLTNGQVYFGKLKVVDENYYKLNDIFYLQTSTDNNTKKVQGASDSASSNVQLIKLGSEIHGPDDEMIITKEQVLFFENIKTDGTVTKSIEKYYSQQ